jgi:hypothetical protein
MVRNWVRKRAMLAVALLILLGCQQYHLRPFAIGILFGGHNFQVPGKLYFVGAFSQLFHIGPDHGVTREDMHCNLVFLNILPS